MHNNFQFLIFTCRSAITPVLSSPLCLIPLGYTTALGVVSVLLVISLVGNVACTVVVCPYENHVEKRTHQHRKVNIIIDLVLICIYFWHGFLQYLKFMTSLLYQSDMYTCTCMYTNN